jgi:hypothetical protein
MSSGRSLPHAVGTMESLGQGGMVLVNWTAKVGHGPGASPQ